VKKHYFFSFVLAALSFVAAKSLEKAGVENYYYQKATNFYKEDGYFDLIHPSEINILPMGVSSFSDLTLMDSSHLVGIEPISGNVVFLDINNYSISSQLSLGSDFRFQAISRIDSTLILMDSENKVHFLVPPYDINSFVSSNETIENFHSSGICLHESTKRLFLISEVQEKEEGQFSSYLYAFNLNKNKLSDEPLFEINLTDIETFAIKNNLSLPTTIVSNSGDTIQGLDLNPSAIAVHPKTNEIYILSSDRSLIVYNQFGEVVNFTLLDASIFSKPTGMTFQENGDLLISNSELLNPSIVKLKWNKLYQSLEGHGLIFGR
jgi:hypothetical protein